MDKSCVRSRVRTRTHGAVGRRRLRPPLTRYAVFRAQIYSQNREAESVHPAGDKLLRSL